MSTLTFEDNSVLNFDDDKILPGIRNINLKCHSGKMHADDIIATALFRICMSDRIVHILSPLTPDADCQAILDTGGKIEITENKIILDHHQRKNYAIKDNGSKYAACGLVWHVLKNFYCKINGFSDEEKDAVDSSLQQFLEEIENVDNGILSDGTRYSSLSYLFSCCNVDPLDSDEERLQSFLEAVDIAEIIIRNMIAYVKRSAKMYVQAENEVKNSTNDKIVYLSRVLPWTQVLKKKPELFDEKLLVLYPSPRDGMIQYYVQAIPVNSDLPFSQRISAPEEWRGLYNEELANVSGVKNALFCHANGFLCAASTEDGARQLAEKILESSPVSL